MISFTCEIKKTELIDAENRLVVARGVGWGNGQWAEWVMMAKMYKFLVIR